eukprot:4047253-Amphidinium_carterae.1
MASSESDTDLLVSERETGSANNVAVLTASDILSWSFDPEAVVRIAVASGVSNDVPLTVNRRRRTE